MHDPKFEKDVQSRLEELSFSPSDAVWAKVERAVNEKKRRKVPFFWFFLLPALGLAGAVGLIYFAAGRGSHTTISARTMTPASATTPVSATTTVSSSSRPTTLSATRATTIPATTTPSTRTITTTSVQPTISRSARATTTTSMRPTSTRPTSTRPTTTRPTTTRPKNTTPDNETFVNISTPAADRSEAANRSEVIDRSGSRTLTSARMLTSARTVPALPGLTSFDRRFPAPAASHLTTQSTSTTAAKTPIQLKPKYSWEAGFAGGIGLSSLNKSLFQQPVVVSDLTPNAAVISGPPKGYTSGIQPDISYWAGIVVQKPLRKSLTLSLGLDLHYYSARVQTGEKVYNDPTSLYSASSLFNNTPSGQGPRLVQSATYPYYSVGSQDVYVNRYYFLEMPVSLLWQFNHSRRLPLFWESGVSLSYLMSSNSLYYNSKSGVFYKDGGMTHKTQLNLATALLVGLPVKGIRLQAGPQIQYGLTGLQNSSVTGQHLFYGGIRVVLLPGKAKK